MAGHWQVGGGVRARRGWVGLGVTLYFNRRRFFYVFSFKCVRLFGFFLIELLSDLLTHGHTLKVLDAAYGIVAIISPPI